MTLARQFVKAEILEVVSGTFKLEITYGYYGLFTFTESFIYNTLNEAVNKLAVERCNGHLRITDHSGMNVVLGHATQERVAQ